jgi:hypothetical protein
MKNLKGIYFLLFTALMACGSGDFREPPTVIFGEPQPAEVENLPAFPKRIQGQFRGLAEGNILNISDKLIISTSEFDEKFEVLANEIADLKDIVLKLQSYTMEVNKMLMEERITVLSDMDEHVTPKSKEVTFNLTEIEEP